MIVTNYIISYDRFKGSPYLRSERWLIRENGVIKLLYYLSFAVIKIVAICCEVTITKFWYFDIRICLRLIIEVCHLWSMILQNCKKCFSKMISRACDSISVLK